VSFIADITAADAWGRAVVSQGIFDQTLDVVRQARRFIVLDYSLFAGTSAARAPQRRIAAELGDALRDSNLPYSSLWRLALRWATRSTRPVFADPAQSDYWLCRLMEGAGLSSF
jgi:hypothetical protein